MIEREEIIGLYLEGWEVGEISKLLHAPQDDVLRIVNDEIGFDEGWKME